MNSKHYDLANIEFKKNSDNMKEDEAKVLVEGKTILNCLSKHHNLDFYKAKKLKVIVGQFCGNFFTSLRSKGAINKMLTDYIF